MGRNTVYTNKNYNIYKCFAKNKDVYFTVHNKNKKFKEAHTHVANFGLAKLVVYTCIKGSPPPKKERLFSDLRFMENVCRVCTNSNKRKFNTIYNNLLEP